MPKLPEIPEATKQDIVTAIAQAAVMNKSIDGFVKRSDIPADVRLYLIQVGSVLAMQTAGIEFYQGLFEAYDKILADLISNLMD